MNFGEVLKLRRKNIGIIFQQFHLVSHLTALENVAVARLLINDPHAFDRASDLLKKVGLSHRASHTPEKLSGGECQRVAIARALISEPAILLADEPSGSLDSKSGEEVMGLLFELSSIKDVTLVLVTHNLELAKRCNKQKSLTEGRLIATS